MAGGARAQRESGEAGGIALRDVWLDRGDAPLFRGLDLTLGERRIGLVGANGSGKSSLLRLINGLIVPARGEITVAGLDARAHRRDLPGRVGFVFQNVDHQILFPTVREEVAFGLAEQGLPRAEARAGAERLLAAHGCAGWGERAVEELSEGQKQLVCILAAIAPGPPILAMDEPLASLDLATRLSLLARLRALPQQILMASHDLDLLADFDRIVWLEAGAVAGDGPPREVLPRYRAHEMARAATAAGVLP
ncbi:energy-coupling factor ABC transporter ATP-binding protein [Azorhizobium doebereinerae]|uniref:energy-coupling factor ABC transporter ATP-binding protein n=1 Tax=Azorhizobium doebereinerae TaxID=281091 RepID=UPI000406BE42|nr:ABC transporter ATP-binding protein [Azorhizobium doebereinerae]